MSDPFLYHAVCHAAITPSDSTDIPVRPRTLYFTAGAAATFHGGW